MKKVLLVLGCSLSLSFMSACAREPGPVERIGRSIDDLAQGIQDAEKEYGSGQDDESQRRARRPQVDDSLNREADLEGSDYYRRPSRDEDSYARQPNNSRDGDYENDYYAPRDEDRGDYPERHPGRERY